MNFTVRTEKKWLCVVYTYFFYCSCEITTDDSIQCILKLGQIEALEGTQAESHACDHYDQITWDTRGCNAYLYRQGAPDAPGNQEWGVNVSVFCYFGHLKAGLTEMVVSSMRFCSSGCSSLQPRHCAFDNVALMRAATAVTLS